MFDIRKKRFPLSLDRRIFLLLKIVNNNEKTLCLGMKTTARSAWATSEVFMSREKRDRNDRRNNNDVENWLGIALIAAKSNHFKQCNITIANYPLSYHICTISSSNALSNLSCRLHCLIILFFPGNFNFAIMVIKLFCFRGSLKALQLACGWMCRLNSLIFF